VHFEIAVLKKESMRGEAPRLLIPERTTGSRSRALISTMEQLSSDLLALVCASLTGFDVFRLSQTSAWLRRATSSVRVWRRFLEAGTPSRVECPHSHPLLSAVQYKREYMRARSLQFRGLFRDSADRFHHDHGAFVVMRELPRVPRMWPPTQAFTQNFGRLSPSPSLTIDAWFSLLPSSDLTLAGGVLFGMQSAPVASSIWPHYHEQPVLIDPSCRLFCSLLEPAEVDMHADPVGSPLDVNRWYHLAMTYSGRNRIESVFVDGVLVSTRAGDLYRHWRHLVHCQVGTGCVTADDRAFPEPEHLGWYGLHGTVDEFRIWEGVLSEAYIKQLAGGGELDDESPLWYSLRDANAHKLKRSGVQLVRCTRPVERAFQLA
jgi:hypothetical protein